MKKLRFGMKHVMGIELSICIKDKSSYSYFAFAFFSFPAGVWFGVWARTLNLDLDLDFLPAQFSAAVKRKMGDSTNFHPLSALPLELRYTRNRKRT